MNEEKLLEAINNCRDDLKSFTVEEDDGDFIRVSSVEEMLNYLEDKVKAKD